MTLTYEQVRALPSVPFGTYRLIPRSSGLYFVVFSDGTLAYIGKSVNLWSRVSQHGSYKKWPKGSTRIHWCELPREIVDCSEKEAIIQLNPTENRCNWSGKWNSERRAA